MRLALGVRADGYPFRRVNQCQTSTIIKTPKINPDGFIPPSRAERSEETLTLD